MRKEVQTTAFVAVAVMFITNGLSKIIGFLREVILAAQIGTSSDGDAYTFAFMLPDILNHLLAGSALSITFIPLFQELAHSPQKQNRFFSNLLTTGTIIFVVGIILLTILAKWGTLLLAGESITENPAQLSLTVLLTRIILPAQLFFFWGALFNGVQYANKSFVRPAITPVVYNSVIILMGIALFPIIGIEGFSWGVLAGAFIGNVVLQIGGVKKCGIRYSPCVDLRDPILRQWFWITTPFILGMGVTFSQDFTFRYFGSRLVDGSGAIIALNYAYKLCMIVVGLFGQSFAGGIYPFLSQKATEKDYGAMERLIINVLSKTIAISIISSALLYPVSQDLIAILFERHAFNAQSTIMTVKAFAGYLPGAFCFATLLILNRLFFAIKKTATPLITSTIALVLSIPLYHLLGETFGITGISGASSIFSFITVVLLVVQWYRFYPQSKLLHIIKTVGVSGIIAVSVALLEYGIWNWAHIPFPNNDTLSRIARLCIAGIPAGVLSLFLLDITHTLSVKDILSRLKRKKTTNTE